MSTRVPGKMRTIAVVYDALVPMKPLSFYCSPNKTQSFASSNTGTSIPVKTTFTDPVGNNYANNGFVTFSTTDTANNTIRILRAGYYKIKWRQTFTVSAAARVFARIHTTAAAYPAGVVDFDMVQVGAAGQCAIFCDASDYYNKDDTLFLGCNLVSASTIAGATMTLDATANCTLKVANEYVADA
jgi:hypothetical protein